MSLRDLLQSIMTTVNPGLYFKIANRRDFEHSHYKYFNESRGLYEVFILAGVDRK